MYNIIADLHTHSTFSTHAYSTMNEMVLAAKEKGLYAIAITDHSYSMPGGPGAWFFEGQKSLPLYQHGVKCITGIESNIMDFDGTVDYDPIYGIDLVIASAHNIDKKFGVKCMDLDNPTIDKCTNMYLNIAKNPYVNIIGHSGTNRYKYDYEKVIPEFKKYHKLVEINSHSYNSRSDSRENCKEIALVCKNTQTPIIVSSDAHSMYRVADFDNAFRMLSSIDFPEELIVNASIERLEEYLNNHTNINNNRKN